LSVSRNNRNHRRNRTDNRADSEFNFVHLNKIINLFYRVNSRDLLSSL
jgi:hypothetical protein